MVSHKIDLNDNVIIFPNKASYSITGLGDN